MPYPFGVSLCVQTFQDVDPLQRTAALRYRKQDVRILPAKFHLRHAEAGVRRLFRKRKRHVQRFAYVFADEFVVGAVAATKTMLKRLVANLERLCPIRRRVLNRTTRSKVFHHLGVWRRFQAAPPLGNDVPARFRRGRGSDGLVEQVAALRPAEVEEVLADLAGPALEGSALAPPDLLSLAPARPIRRYLFGGSAVEGEVPSFGVGSSPRATD